MRRAKTLARTWPRRWTHPKPAPQNWTDLTAYDRYCHIFSLDRSPRFSYPDVSSEPINPMDSSRRRFSNGQRAQERIDDGRGDLPLLEDYPADTLPLSSESQNSRLQAWERMAIRTFGSGTVDSRPNQGLARPVKETLQ